MNGKFQMTGSVASAASKTRCSNLELFRIITMIFIVAHHYVVNSGLMELDGPIYSDPISWKSMFLLIFGAFGKTGINCFVLISGYFMCQSNITEQKFFKLLFEIEFYKVAIWAVFLITGYEQFNFVGLLKALLPVRTIATGFTSCYLLFFLFIPFLNILVRNMNEKQHVKLLLLCVFMYTIIGSIPGFGVTMNYVSWFIVLYFIGAYIRIYDKRVFSKTVFWRWCTLWSLLITVMSVVVMTCAGKLFEKDGRASYWFLSDSNKILAVVLALSTFMWFKNIKMENSILINKVAASTFGVLLIHANSDTMRRWLWKDILNNVRMYSSDWLILHAFGSVIFIYAVCTIIDYTRIQFVEKPFFKFWDKHWWKIKAYYQKYENKVCGFFQIYG